jgi:EGF-like domain
MPSQQQSPPLIVVGLLLIVELPRLSIAILNDNHLSAAQHRALQGILPHGVSDCSASFIEASLQTPVTTQATASLFDHQVQAYCSNGGFCKAMYRDDPFNPCQCLEGYSGPHCEFVGSNVAPGLSCTLNCQNDGVCRIGAETWEKLLQYDYDATPQDQRQYCSCPNGYYGTLCEYGMKDNIIHLEKCGDEPCLNGGVCKEVLNQDGSTSRQCDCSGAKVLGVPHAGQFCEHNATDVCAVGEYGGQVFCVNGGTCKSDA